MSNLTEEMHKAIGDAQIEIVRKSFCKAARQAVGIANMVLAKTEPSKKDMCENTLAYFREAVRIGLELAENIELMTDDEIVGAVSNFESFIEDAKRTLLAFRQSEDFNLESLKFNLKLAAKDLNDYHEVFQKLKKRIPNHKDFPRFKKIGKTLAGILKQWIYIAGLENKAGRTKMEQWDKLFENCSMGLLSFLYEDYIEKLDNDGVPVFD